MSDRAIGVFDSGVGGLTVLKEMLRLLPEEELVYLGDTARVPYGTKSSATVLRYAMEAAAFFEAIPVKMLVVACNTASAVALKELQSRFDFPVVGVIEPGARKAVRVTKNRKVGVIGTEGTVKSGAYRMAIETFDPDVEVLSVPAPLFVPLAEEGWTEHPVTTMVAREYLEPLLEEGVDTLVLGCTHYPLLKPAISSIVGEGVTLVDSAEETALMVRSLLEKNTLLTKKIPVKPRFYVTDVSDRFRYVGGNFLGLPLHDVLQIDLEERPFFES